MYPSDPTIAENLKKARAELNYRRQKQIAAGNIQQTIENLTHSLNALPSSDGSDLDFLADSSTPAGANGQSPAPNLGGFLGGDPSVVDARDVPTGLPKSVEAEFQTPPPATAFAKVSRRSRITTGTSRGRGSRMRSIMIPAMRASNV